MKKKICIVLCLGCIGTVSVVGCSNKNFDSKVTGDNQTTTENVSDILNDQEKKEGGYENESSSNADDKENSADDSEVLANADLRGAVLEFSDTGCNISIGTQTDDAEMVPAPGAVVEEMNQVKIVYGENTYFQISHSTMTGITLEDCRKEEVKKQSKQERKSIMYGDSYRPENTIFTDMSFPEKPSGNEGNPFYQYAIFKVQNAGKYDQVKKSVQKANIDWSRYDLIDNNGNIKNMTENFGQMDQMSMGLLLIVSVSGLVILVLVFLFWIKNRTQEIGIMMSLGKCKFEIWVQFLWEAVMISIIGMLLSFAISPIIAETSASYLAKETQTLRLEQQEQENTGTYIDGYIAPDLKIQDVEVHITKEMVLMDIGMISGILIIAVLVAGITIMKKRPKQILSEMS